MHKEGFIINCNTLLHVSTLLGHLQGELSVVVTLRRELSAVPASLRTASLRPGPQRVHASKNNAVHSQQHILTQPYRANLV
jgi:hypothetical protein